MASVREPLLEIGRVIAGHRIAKFLGVGGMGQVYLCEDVEGKEVALKIISAREVTPSQAERFHREANLAATIHHPNVVKIFGAGWHEGQQGTAQEKLHYILMEYVHGQNLEEMVRNAGRLPSRKALKIVRDAARGLAAAHEGGLIHRDIKPSNIMLADERQRGGGYRTILMDFGLARAEEPATELTPAGQAIGTPAYMSPEQWGDGKAVGKRSDIYSLGATAYFLLTGRLPFEGPLYAIVAQITQKRRPTPVHRIDTGIPKAVSDIITRAMEFDLAKRFPDASTLVDAIDRLLGLQGADSPPEQGRVPPVPRVERGQAPSSAVPGGRGISFGAWRGNRGEAATPGSSETPRDFIKPESEDPPAFPRVNPDPQLKNNSKLAKWLASAILLRTGWAWAVLGLILGLSLVALVVVLSPRPQSTPVRPEPEKKPVDRPGMIWVPAGPVPMSTSEELLREHAGRLEGVRDSPRLIADFVQKAADPPRRTAQVPGFWIDKHEVTNADYARFLQRTQRPPPLGWRQASPPPGEEQHPITGIGHDDALAYAAWSSKKLPTNEQWVRAFRGGKEWLFPWGDQWEPTRANVMENTRFRGTTPVLATPADVSPFGVLNLVGNVDEMVRNLEKYPDANAPCVVTRGATWKALGAIYGVATFKTFYTQTATANSQTGFRCVVEEE